MSLRVHKSERSWHLVLRVSAGEILPDALLALLGFTGFALFFLSSDRWQRFAQLSHDALGLGIVLFALQHWFFGRRGQTTAA